ncbi:unnamed protein product [Thlaspi arvense]|uniref:Uncharacterized protein n=1 Tax=Thlaspi arvense TaxID=13288 RepID=A0AAU9RUP5_THLAR|nr:unnamed protein product [Thlaspi arvense]
MRGSKEHVASKTSSSPSIVKPNPSDNKVATIEAPIVSSYNDRIRPLLDTVDRLRNLNVMKEGIQLPTIVVVGDQSSGKSSQAFDMKMRITSYWSIVLRRMVDTIALSFQLSVKHLVNSQF